MGLIPEDAIQEFQVVTNRFSAEYGHSSGPLHQRRHQVGTERAARLALRPLPQRRAAGPGLLRDREAGLRAPAVRRFIGGPLSKDRTFGFFADRAQPPGQDADGQHAGRVPAVRGLVRRAVPRPHDGGQARPPLQRVAVGQPACVVPEEHLPRGPAQRSQHRHRRPPTESAFQEATNTNLSLQAMHTWLVSGA